jgi:Na+-transporting NADH:ubiquinone oxidoreductase subunit C
MFILTLCFTSVVSAVKHVNQERIRTNEEVKFRAVVLETLKIPVPEGPGRKESIAEVFNRRVRTVDVAGRRLYAGYDEAAETIIGYAFPAGGPGFWGPIEAMVAVNPEATAIVGVNFTRHTETPGLGARMTEEAFRGQFQGVALSKAEGEDLYFRLVQPGTAIGAGELDAITGATQTSLAIERFLNRELDVFIGTVAARLEERR